MKTVPHIVEERHLKLFHPEGVKNPTKAPAKKTRQVKVKTPAKKKTQMKKSIKGRITKKSRQSVTRRQRGNIKDIFSK